MIVMLVSTAWGQSFLDGCEHTLPSRQWARDMSDSNAELYGVMSASERLLMPYLFYEDGDKHTKKTAALFLESNFIASGVDLPGSSCTEWEVGEVDISAMSMGFGFSRPWFGLFYASSITGTTMIADPMDRVIADTSVVYNAYYMFVAPFVGARQFDTRSSRFNLDWVAGASVSPATLNISVGYLGSQGIFHNINEDTTRLFVQFAAQEAYQRLPWWAIGLYDVPWPEEWKDRIGRTKVFGRSVEWYAVPVASDAETTETTDTGEEEADTEAAKPPPFSTLHLHQTFLDERLAVRLAVQRKPSWGFHEAVATVSPVELEYGFLYAEAGLVSLPPVYHYGITGDVRWVVNIGATATPQSYGRTDGEFTFAIRRNHTDTLTTFPYAADAWQVYVGFGFGEQND
ncbi:MAG: hypothetical protein ACI8RZ_001862 [Myxococcota bacterium]|jgi:hypothetical protein